MARSGESAAPAREFPAYSLAFDGKALAASEKRARRARRHTHPEVLKMDWRERIVTNPDILVGKPSVKGTRLSVELILGWLAQGWTIEVLLENYPTLSREDVLAALAFAVDMMRDERYIAIHQAA